MFRVILLSENFRKSDDNVDIFQSAFSKFQCPFLKLVSLADHIDDIEYLNISIFKTSKIVQHTRKLLILIQTY